MGRRQILDSVLSKIGFGVYRKNPIGRLEAISGLVNIERTALAKTIAEALNYTVQRGPFKGMILPKFGAWSDKDIASKILGSYERELFDCLYDLKKQKITSVINVGASEGFYAIGIKRMLPDISGYTFDIDENSFVALQNCQDINNVAVTRLLNFSFSKPFIDLNAKDKKRPLFFLDCEGFELELIKIPDQDIKKSLFIIELHEFAKPNLTKEIIKHLSKTHEVKFINQSSRDIYEYEELKDFIDLQKMFVLYEGRTVLINWIYAVPKK